VPAVGILGCHLLGKFLPSPTIGRSGTPTWGIRRMSPSSTCAQQQTDNSTHQSDFDDFFAQRPVQYACCSSTQVLILQLLHIQTLAVSCCVSAIYNCMCQCATEWLEACCCGAGLTRHMPQNIQKSPPPVRDVPADPKTAGCPVVLADSSFLALCMHTQGATRSRTAHPASPRRCLTFATL
jgi:hypothetical protein